MQFSKREEKNIKMSHLFLNYFSIRFDLSLLVSYHGQLLTFLLSNLNNIFATDEYFELQIIYFTPTSQVLLLDYLPSTQFFQSQQLNTLSSLLSL